MWKQSDFELELTFSDFKFKGLQYMHKNTYWTEASHHYNQTTVFWTISENKLILQIKSN